MENILILATWLLLTIAVSAVCVRRKKKPDKGMVVVWCCLTLAWTVVLATESQTGLAIGKILVSATWLLLTIAVLADYVRRKKKPDKLTVLVWCFALVGTVVFAAEALGAEGQTGVGVRTEEVFTIGFDDSELHFGVIVAMAMFDDGRIVVSDYGSTDAPQIAVVSAEGDVVAQWGRMGDGPGELDGVVMVGIEGETIVAAGMRTGLYTWQGAETRRWSAPSVGGMTVKVALAAGNVIAWRMTADVSDGGLFAMVLGASDGSRVWHKRRADDFMRLFNPFRAFPLLASMPEGRVVAGYGDKYVLHVIAGESGDTLGTIARDVSQRRPTASFLRDLRRHLAHPGEAPEDWSSLVRRSAPPVDMADGIESFPMITNVFWGPPGALWVERGLGVDDEYAGPLGRPNASRLWDIFDVGGTEATFLGAVSLPDGFRPMAGNDSLLAGVVSDDLERSAARVLRVVAPGAAVGRRAPASK